MIRSTSTLLSISAASLLVASNLLDHRQDSTPDFAKELGVEVSNLTPLDPPSKDLVRQVSKRIGERAKFLDGVRLYAGQTSDRSGVAVEGRFAEVMLEGHDGIRIVMGFTATGDALGVNLWGTPEIDDDPTFRWTGFLGQLRNLTRGTGMSLATDENSAKPDAWKRALKQVPSKDRSLAEALVEHRLLMRGNSQMVGQLFFLQRSGSAPPLEWIDYHRKRFERLRDLEEELGEAFSSSGLDSHTRVTIDVLAALDTWKSKLETGKDAFLAIDPSQQLRGNCGACHELELKAGQGPLQDALAARLKSFNLPEGLLQLDYDIARMPVIGRPDKREEKLQQDIATAFRGVILLFDGMK